MAEASKLKRPGKKRGKEKMSEVEQGGSICAAVTLGSNRGKEEE